MNTDKNPNHVTETKETSDRQAARDFFEKILSAGCIWFFADDAGRAAVNRTAWRRSENDGNVKYVRKNAENQI
jgi:hypothetical protein